MRLARIFFATALAATGSLAAVAGADAAVRYASPSSATTSGPCSTALTPCRLDFAISGAADGDTVVLAAGTYAVNYAVTAGAAIDVSGTTGQPRPQIVGDASRTGATINMSAGGSLKHVSVVSNSANPAVISKGLLVENAVVTSSTGRGVLAKAGSGATIRDSVVHTTGPGSALVLTDDEVTGPLNVVNVTAISSGAGTAAIDNGSGGVVSIVNTIARGAAYDIVKSGSVQNAQVSYSNYRPVASTGLSVGPGSQSAAPVFADSAYRQTSASVTIDAGTAGVASLGSLDPDGNLRVLGVLPDIGAYEHVGLPDPNRADPGAISPGGASDPITGTDTGTGPGTDRGNGTPPVLPPSARPVLGRNVDLGPVRGTVRVTLPGTSQAVVLEDGANVPVGSLIDATDGVVALTSVRDSNGRTQTGRFWGGAFKVRQSRKGDQYTVLKLVGAMGCEERGKLSAAGRRRSARRLWGRDHRGRFRTRGRRGQATVRGTKWLTEDRCDGTLFRVKRGAIVVRDFGKSRKAKLTRGERYLARTR